MNRVPSTLVLTLLPRRPSPSYLLSLLQHKQFIVVTDESCCIASEEAQSSWWQGGMSFKLDQYSFILACLHTRRQEAIRCNIYSPYHPACVMELCTSLSTPLADMQKGRMGIESAMKSPSHLELGMPNTSSEDNVTTGLINFELNPKSIVNKFALFEHLVQFRRRTSSEGDTRPSDYLDVPMTADQDIIIDPTLKDLTAHEIMKTAGGEGATEKLAQRKLNNSGAITSHSGIQN